MNSHLTDPKPNPMVSELTFDEYMKLSCIPLYPLPENASFYYQQIHKVLCDGSKEKASWEHKKYAVIMRAALKNQSIVKMLTASKQIVSALTHDEVRHLLSKPLAPLPEHASTAYQQAYHALNGGSHENTAESQKHFASFMQKALQEAFNLNQLAEKIVSELEPHEIKHLLSLPLGSLLLNPSKAYKQIHKALNDGRHENALSSQKYYAKLLWAALTSSP